MARALVERHGGEVPRTLEELMALPGVGRKTANVVLGNAFGIPALAVDTHVFRVSQRLGLARGDDAEKIHDQLCQVLPRPRWTQATPPAHPPRPARLRGPQAGLPDLPGRWPSARGRARRRRPPAERRRQRRARGQGS